MEKERNLSEVNTRAFEGARRRFPQCELAIRRLLRSNEDFRDLCEDLADAEFSLESVSHVAEALREARRKEWQELVDSLVLELERVLRGNLGRGPRAND